MVTLHSQRHCSTSRKTCRRSSYSAEGMIFLLHKHTPVLVNSQTALHSRINKLRAFSAKHSGLTSVCSCRVHVGMARQLPQSSRWQRRLMKLQSYLPKKGQEAESQSSQAAGMLRCHIILTTNSLTSNSLTSHNLTIIRLTTTGLATISRIQPADSARSRTQSHSASEPPLRKQGEDFSPNQPSNPFQPDMQHRTAQDSAVPVRPVHSVLNEQKSNSDRSASGVRLKLQQQLMRPQEQMHNF